MDKVELTFSSQFAFVSSSSKSVGSMEPLNLPARFFIFSSGVYVCLIKVRAQSEELLQALSVADTSVYGWATLVHERSKNGTQRILIPFVPAFHINQSELVLSHRQDVGEIRVLGVDRVLEKLEVREGPNQNMTKVRLWKKESPFRVQGRRNSH